MGPHPLQPSWNLMPKPQPAYLTYTELPGVAGTSSAAEARVLGSPGEAAQWKGPDGPGLLANSRVGGFDLSEPQFLPPQNEG